MVLFDVIVDFFYMCEYVFGLCFVCFVVEDVLILKLDFVVCLYGGGLNFVRFFEWVGIFVL